MMGDNLRFDYYYGVEAEQFSFYRMPRMLIKDERFRGLSSDAKLLYGLMLDRLAMSVKHGWFDDENRAYIYYTVENIMEDLGCARATCVKIMAELDSKKGIGLIEKKRQGLGKPDIIYVKNFVTVEEDKQEKSADKTGTKADISTEVQNLNFKNYKNYTSGSSENEIQEVQDIDFKNYKNYTSGDSENETQEFQKSDFKNYKNYTSGISKSETQEFQKMNPNYNNINYTDFSYNNSIHPSNQGRESGGGQSRDRNDLMDEAVSYMTMIKNNIEYDHYMNTGDVKFRELYDELYGIICEVVCVRHKSVRIGGDDYPYELVKSKFLKLNSSHINYVIECMKNTTTKISNIKAYMLTALYNAPNTINHYYQQEVQHDMYGGVWEEKGII